jgi:hypothetical protein
MDACNSSEILKTLSNTWMDEIWKEARELKQGTDYVNSHPILLCCLDKLAQLARHGRYVMQDNRADRTDSLDMMISDARARGVG